MYQKKTIKKDIQVIDERSLVCNKCGQKIYQEAFDIKTEPPMNTIEIGNIGQLECCPVKVSWGYWSKNKDTQMHEWELCEACYDAFVATFAVPPKITHYM